jgi:hypothetical protein
VINRIATLQEIETHYDLVDILDAHTALDLQNRADDIAYENAMNGLKR